jgi:DnaJ-class molecular chaperone
MKNNKQYYIKCKYCDGTGYVSNYPNYDCDVKTCPKCKGEGEVLRK